MPSSCQLSVTTQLGLRLYDILRSPCCDFPCDMLAHFGVMLSKSLLTHMYSIKKVCFQWSTPSSSSNPTHSEPWEEDMWLRVLSRAKPLVQSLLLHLFPLCTSACERKLVLGNINAIKPSMIHIDLDILANFSSLFEISETFKKH